MTEPFHGLQESTSRPYAVRAPFVQCANCNSKTSAEKTGNRKNMTDSIVQLSSLTKRYGRRCAVNELNATLSSGHILGLVGPNGSGKTTLLKLLAGFLRPSSGSVRVFGLNPFRDRERVMLNTRFVFAPPALYANLTARETLHSLTRLGHHHHPDINTASFDRALRIVGLCDRGDDRIRVFSSGMRQRLALALALVPMPRLLVLDEPTDGLDPLAVLELRDLLLNLRDEHGVSIIMASHLILEVEKLVDRLVLLHEGRSLFVGPPSELTGDGRQTCLVIDGNQKDAARAAEMLRGAGLHPTSLDSNRITLPKKTLTLEEATSLLKRGGVRLVEFYQRTPTLEEAMLQRLRTAGAAVRTPIQPSASRRPEDN